MEEVGRADVLNFLCDLYSDSPVSVMAYETEDKKDAPFSPTKTKYVPIIVEQLDVAEGDCVLDLGCGDGRILVGAALLKGARGIGYEKNPTVYEFAKQKVKKAGLDDCIEIHLCDIARDNLDLSIARGVYLYLGQSANKKIQKKLKRGLCDGATVVSLAFHIPGWKKYLEKNFSIDCHNSLSELYKYVIRK